MKKIGAITVGQTPRTDLIPEIAPILGDSIEIIQMGGLDGLTKEEIQTMTPAPGDHVLVSLSLIHILSSRHGIPPGELGPGFLR